MSKEFQIRDGDLIASFDLENEDGDIDFCKLLKVSHGVADEIGMFVDYVATNKIIKDQSKKIADLEAKLAEAQKTIEIQKMSNNALQEENLDYRYDITDTAYEQAKYMAESWEEDYQQEITELKQQLAEKEQENERLKEEICKYEITLMDKNSQLKNQLHDLPNKIVENTKLKIEKLYLELLLTRLQWIHKRADDCRLEKERFGGIEDMALDSVWRVFDLQHHECANYEEMCELDEGIRCIAEDNLLRDIEHNLQFNVSKSEDEIFEEIRNLQTILKKYGGENE